jgi:CheY-like chemotaxis protein
LSRVTVIDDSSDFLELMRQVLYELDHEMIGLRGVRSSVEEVVATRPDVLMVDLRLDNTPQEISGWELLLLVRSHRDLREVPVIVCSADLRALKNRSRDLANANVHVLAKPFSLEEVGGLLNRLVPTPA